MLGKPSTTEAFTADAISKRGQISQLLTRVIAAGTVYHHIFPDKFPDPLGFGLSSSRFSDPRPGVKNRFGVYYVAASFEGAFLETLVRDRRDYLPGTLFLPESELDRYACVAIVVDRALTVADLLAGNPVAMGIPTDAVRARRHREGQRLSLSLYRHKERPDGICYPSRLNEGQNLAIYDRSLHKVSSGPRRKLIECLELAVLLDHYRIALV